MRPFPKYWSTHRESVSLDDGRRVWDVVLRGWSDLSPADAARVAFERLQEFRRRNGQLPTDEYYWGLPVREETLHQLSDGEDLIAIVSRNRYGAEILNTDALLIADVDLPGPTPTAARGLFGRLLGRPQPAADHPQEAGARRRIAEFVARHPQWGVRTYRTCGGFRILVTGTSFRPESEDAQALLRELDSDPLYMTLCRRHDSYRARLTPKPWRIGVKSLNDNWPRTPALQQHAQRWIARYRQAAEGYATCRLEQTAGPEPTAIEQQVIDLHDRVTRVGSPLPLA